MTSASLDLYRDLRDAAVETTFFRTYTGAALASQKPEKAPAAPVAPRAAPAVAQALSKIEEGGRTKAVVRIALLIMEAGKEQRRLSSMKRIRDLVGDDIGLVDMPGDVAQEIVREQSYIVEFEPARALAALPRLLPKPEDRRFALGLLDKVEGKIESTVEQTEMLAKIRNLLDGGKLVPLKGGKQGAVPSGRSNGSHNGHRKAHPRTHA